MHNTHSEKHRGHLAGAAAGPFVPRLIAWEITRSCNLQCKHCRAAAQAGAYEGELSLGEIKKVIDNVAAHFQPIVILTGGEPMLRPDLLDIVRYTRGAGLRPVMATCGTMLTEDRARELLEAGVQRISVSLDGPDAASHDAFRGVPGAFAASLAGIEAARNADLPFQVNTTVTRHNMNDVARILDLAVKLGAAAFHPFLLVPIGRGKELVDDLLNAEEYERVLHQIYDMSQSSPIPFKPTCAPHYYRVLRQREKEQGREVTPETHGLDAMSKGCLGGTGFVFISHTGDVQICGFLDEKAGNVRESSYDFVRIWRESPLFLAMRDFRRYKGKCGICEFRRWCGGCRARAFAMTGDYLESEPYCAYVPEAHEAG